MKRIFTTLAATGSLMMVAGTTQAGIVASFGTPTAINSNDDIINAGGVITAINAGNETSNVSVTTSAGAVVFTPGESFDGFGLYSNASYKFSNEGFFVDNNPAAGTVAGSNTSDFHQVLDSFYDNTNFYFEFTGLAEGTYTLQVFQSDDRGNRNQEWKILTNPDTLGEAEHASVSFTSNNDTFRSTYVTATVTLTAGTDSFAFARFGDGEVNAVVLSQVPEPGSLALLGLGGLLIARRRRGCSSDQPRA